MFGGKPTLYCSCAPWKCNNFQIRHWFRCYGNYAYVYTAKAFECEMLASSCTPSIAGWRGWWCQCILRAYSVVGVRAGDGWSIRERLVGLWLLAVVSHVSRPAIIHITSRRLLFSSVLKPKFPPLEVPPTAFRTIPLAFNPRRAMTTTHMLAKDGPISVGSKDIDWKHHHHHHFILPKMKKIIGKYIVEIQMAGHQKT